MDRYRAPLHWRSALRHVALRQALSFLVIGLLQLLPDWACFVLLSSLGVPVPLANILGRIAGACLGYWLNGRFTFAQGGRAALGRRQFIRFWAAWVVLTVLSTLAVSLLAAHANLGWAWLGKPVVDAVLAGLGYFVAKYWIFR